MESANIQIKLQTLGSKDERRQREEQATSWAVSHFAIEKIGPANAVKFVDDINLYLRCTLFRPA